MNLDDAVTTESMEFGHLVIDFDERVLRPRPWTAMQSRWAAELVANAPDGKVLELCSGAGHIGLLAIALEPRALVCVDLNPAACSFTRSNAARAGLTVEVRQGDLAEALALDETFALVIADPPWVPAADTDRFPEDPLSAIDGGADGLHVARLCLEVAGRHVAPGGPLLLQLGTRAQAHRLADHATRQRLRLVEIRDGERGIVARFDRLVRADGE